MQKSLAGKPQPGSPRRHSRPGLLPGVSRPSRVTSLSNNIKPKRSLPEPVGNFCATHNRVIELYCLTCNEPLCPDCTVFANHYQHKIVTSREAEGRTSLRNDPASPDLTALKAELIKRGAAFRSEWQVEKARLTGEVSSFFSEIIRRLEARKNDATKQISEFFDFAADNFHRKREELEGIVESLASRPRPSTAEARHRMADQLEKLRRRVAALTAEAFVRQKLRFVANKDWRETLEGFAMLESVKNPDFNGVWEICDDGLGEGIEEVGSASKVGHLVPSKTFGSRDNSIDPVRRDDAPNYRPLDKDPISITEWCDFSTNLYKSEAQNARQEEFKTPKMNGSVDKNSPGLAGEDLIYTRKNLFHRTMVANGYSAPGPSERRGSDVGSLRRPLNRSAINNPLELTDQSPGRASTARGVSMSNAARTVSHQMSSSKLVKPFGEFLPNLDFSHKSMTVDEMIKMFEDTVITGPIKILNLSHNSISDVGIKRILKTLVKLSFEELDLTGNKLTVVGLEYLLSFAGYNQALRLVHLRDNIRLLEDEGEVRRRAELLEKRGVRVVL